MKKLFFFLAAMLVTLAVNATIHEIGSATSNILGSTVASANDGDVIILTDNGPYVNSKTNKDDYTKLQKNLTIQAADGKTPVVQYEVPFRSTGGKTVKFIGITFDGTSLTEYDWYFRFYDANDNLEFEDCEFKNISKYVFDVYTGKSANSLKLTNCKLHDISSRGILNRGTLTSLEINGGQIYNFTGYPVLDNYENATLGKVKINGTEFYGNKKDIISADATSHADSCIINNCYFHNNDYSAVYFNKSSVDGRQTISGLKVTNSTFANNNPSKEYRALIDVQSYNREATNDIEVVVDHCTFYNNTTINYDYSAIRTRIANRTTVSNCIFAHPSAIEFYAANVWAGSVTNCLAYNLSKGYSAPTKTNANTGNPLFTDAASGDFTLSTESPAIDAGTDGKTLGDSRWWPVITYPETDFSGDGYVFKADDATLTGSIDLISDSEPHYIRYADYANPGTAAWKITATRACKVNVTLNLGTYGSHKHIFEVQLCDEDGLHTLDTIAEGAAWASGPGDDGFTEENQDKTLEGYLTIPAAGTYTIKLLNNRKNSKMGIYGVTMKAIQTLYLKPTSDWKSDGARFALYTMGEEKWYDMTAVEGFDGIFKAVIASSITQVIFCRMDGAAAENNWGNKWNQTQDMTIEEGKDLCIINNWDGGVWSTHVNNGYYLVGKFGGVDAWDASDLTEEKLFAINPSDDKEYTITATLAAGDEFKAVKIESDAWTWYPSEGGNFVVDASRDGEKTIYFRPDGDGGEGWHAGTLYVAPREPKTFYDNTSFKAGSVWTAVEWNITRTAEKKLAFELTWTGDVPGIVPQINLGDYVNMAVDGKKATYTTTATYEDGAELSGAFFYLAYAGGAKRIDFTYTVGAENEKPDTPEPPAQYNVYIADGIVNGSIAADKTAAEVGETVTITISPAANYELDELTVTSLEPEDITINGLTATFAMPGQAVEVNATFKAAAEPSPEPATWYDATYFTSEGSPAVWTAVEWNITRNANRTLTIEVSWTEDVTGMVPKINLGAGIIDMAQAGRTGTHTTTAVYTDGTDLEGAYFYLPYAGGVKQIDIVYSVGSANTKPDTPVKPQPGTAIDNANANAKAVKSIVNGQLLITRDGKTYNVLGTIVK